jgi:hypothetical protein
MAVNFNNHLVRILDDTSDNRRNDIWLWHRLTNQHYQKLGDLNQPGMQAKMKHILASDPEFYEIIESNKKELLLPEKHFEWINEGQRQVVWLTSRLKHNLGVLPSLTEELTKKRPINSEH